MEENMNKITLFVSGLILLAVIIVTGMIIISSMGEGVTSIVTFSSSESILTDNGTATTLSENPTSLTATTYNNSWLSFDGVNDQLGGLDIGLIDWGKNLSLSLWLNSSEQGGYSIYEPFITGISPENANSGTALLLELIPEGNLTWDLGSSCGSDVVFNYTEVNNSQWQHLFLTFNKKNSTNADFYLYVNGELNSNITTLWDGGCASGYDFWLAGRGTSSENDYFRSEIDEVRLYNNYLNNQEVLEIYNSGRIANSSLPTDGLILWLPLNEGSGTDVHTFNQSDFT